MLTEKGNAPSAPLESYEHQVPFHLPVPLIFSLSLKGFRVEVFER